MTDPTRWPDGKRAAISITMDNMGEAAEILRGTWPADRPVGQHYSVLEALPLMLEMLSSYGARATYFIEAFNAGIYPDAIHSVSLAGHEIAFHGWQHEPWALLDADRERELFSQSLDAFAGIGVTAAGFRPPGGVLTSATLDLLREYGFTYCSPAGKDAAAKDGITYLPFEWQGIDAYYYSEGFGGLRAAKGDAPETLSPDVFAERVISIIDDRVETAGYTALLFHPFLETDPDRLDAMRRILGRVMGDDRIWCAPGQDVAEWILSRPDEFSEDPRLDTTSWSR